MKISRAVPIVTLALGVLAAPLLAVAQRSGIPRVGVVDALGPADGTLRLELSQGLRELGYVEGKNIVIEARFAGGSHERAAQLAREMVRLKFEVVSRLMWKIERRLPASSSRSRR